MKQQNRMMVETACSICRKTRSKGILLYGDMIDDFESPGKNRSGKKG